MHQARQANQRTATTTSTSTKTTKALASINCNGSISLQDISRPARLISARSGKIMTASIGVPASPEGMMSPSLSTGSVATVHRKRAAFLVDKLIYLKKYEPMTRLTRFMSNKNNNNNGYSAPPMPPISLSHTASSSQTSIDYATNNYDEADDEHEEESEDDRHIEEERRNTIESSCDQNLKFRMHNKNKNKSRKSLDSCYSDKITTTTTTTITTSNNNNNNNISINNNDGKSINVDRTVNNSPKLDDFNLRSMSELNKMTDKNVSSTPIKQADGDVQQPRRLIVDDGKANIKVSSCSTSSSMSTTVSMDSLASSNQSSVLTNYATNSTSSTHSVNAPVTVSAPQAQHQRSHNIVGNYLPPFKLKIRLHHKSSPSSNHDQKDGKEKIKTINGLLSKRKLSAGITKSEQNQEHQQRLAVSPSPHLNHSSSANDIEHIAASSNVIIGPQQVQIDSGSKSCSTSNNESDCSSNEGALSSSISIQFNGSNGAATSSNSMKSGQSTGSLSTKTSSSDVGGGKILGLSGAKSSDKKSKRKDNLNQLNKLVEYLHKDVQPKLLSLEADELELAQSYKKHSTKLCDYCLNHANLDDLLNNQPGFRSATSNSSSRVNVASAISTATTSVTSRSNSPTLSDHKNDSIDQHKNEKSGQTNDEPMVRCYNCSAIITAGNSCYPYSGNDSNNKNNPSSSVAASPTTTISGSSSSDQSPTQQTSHLNVSNNDQHLKGASSPELYRPPSNSAPHNIASWIDNEITSLIKELEAKKRLSST